MSPENWEENLVSSNFVKFNRVGDFIKGVLIDIYTPESPDVYGKKNRRFGIKAIEGKWSELDGTEKVAVVGDVYRVGSKPGIDAQMGAAIIGQRIMFKFTESRKSKMGNPAKIITVYSPKDAEGRIIIDQDFLDSQTMSV